MEQRDREGLAEASNLQAAEEKKPLLVQIMEKFLAGEAPVGALGI